MNPGWIDFAKPSLSALINSVQNGGSGGGPASTGGPAGGVTDSEVHGAHKAAAERGTEGSSGRKKCSKGKSCNATCIFYMDDCLLVFPDPGVQASLTHVRDMLRSMVSRGSIGEEDAANVFKSVAGLDTKKVRDLPKNKDGEEADLRPTKNAKGKEVIHPALKDTVRDVKQRAENLQEGMRLLEKEIPDPKARQKALDELVSKIYTHTYGKPKMDDLDTVEAIASPKQQKIIKEGAKIYDEFTSGKKEITPQNVQEAMSNITAQMKVREPAEWEVKMGLGLISTNAATYMSKAGSVDKGAVFVPGQKLTDLPKEYAPTAKASEQAQAGRRELILRKLMSQDFKDVYSGLSIHTANMDLEHFLPFSKFGIAAEVGNNYYATTMSSNRKKGDKSPDYFNTKNPTGYFQTKAATKTKPAEIAQFDSKGKLSPASRKVFEDEFSGKGRLKALSEEILGLKLSAREAEAAIAALRVKPAEKAALMAKLISAQLTDFTGIPVRYTVAVGLQSGGRAQQPWYWSGKDLEGAKFGKLVNDKMQKLIESGDTRKLLQLANIMQNAQRAQLNINETLLNGAKIRDTELAGELRTQVGNMIKTTRDSFVSEIEAL
jgi:hypothetical protein